MTRKAAGEIVVGDRIAAVWIKAYSGVEREWLDWRKAPGVVTWIQRLTNAAGAEKSRTFWLSGVEGRFGLTNVTLDKRCSVEVVEDAGKAEVSG